ncbi:MAG: DNA repair protein RecO [Lachnospiraceae bacterium]|nr:DNA repair protein RecO [Lachnospiraceae bacterium]
MSSNYEVTGMVLSSVPAGEYDRRIEILTRERGRISGFATGARRPGSPVMAAAQPFVFGTFVISEGRSAYKIRDARVENFFPKLRTDVSLSCYGSYFMEVLQYVTRENNDETALLMLAYQSLRALESDVFDNRLVRAVFEIKTVMIEGEYPGPRRDTQYLDATLYTLDYLFKTAPARVYTFGVKPEVLEELAGYAKWLCKKTWDHRFQSLEILELLA